MLVVAEGLGLQTPALKDPTGWFGFDLFRLINESFSKTLAGVGLMFMFIGGFVAYMDTIGASHALVRVAMKPLAWFKRYPYASASLVIPIGQMLFVCIPSAAGLGLLLMASVFPLMVALGISRLSAVSVIVACTSFGMGPASAMTARASEIAAVPTIEFFVQHQLPLVLPMSLLMSVSFFFVNRYYDRTEILLEPEQVDSSAEVAETEPSCPAYYAFLPVFPLILLLAFSNLFAAIASSVKLDTTTAMFVSMGCAVLVEGVRKRNLQDLFGSLKVFWTGMGNIFKTVVTLIIAADIFSRGLISLGFIDALLSVSQGAGFAAAGIGVVMTVMIFGASMLMGSGNASFFAFGPLIPNIATSLGAKSVYLIVPMQLSASMGRSVSPIAGVVIATAEIAKVPTLAIAKRNLIPLTTCLFFMVGYHFWLM